MQQTEKIIDEKIQGKALVTEHKKGNTKKLFIESYGCQMNMNDSEIVAAILSEQGFNTTQHLEDADLVLVNTCSIREKAETTVRNRLKKYNAAKKVNPTMNMANQNIMYCRSLYGDNFALLFFSSFDPTGVFCRRFAMIRTAAIRQVIPSTQNSPL